MTKSSAFICRTTLRRRSIGAAALIAALAASGVATYSAQHSATSASPASQRLTLDEVRTIAGQAYTFAYPLVLVEMTRRVTTMGGSPETLNRFRHQPAFPDDRFREVVRPNADTLYSTAWFDLSKEPVLLHVPDTKDRYYLMQIVDAWGETIASPGKRTTGTGEGWFALVGPGWKGTLPANVRRIDCPTSTVSLIGRTQTNGPSDYAFVHTIQQGFMLSPLKSYPNGLPPLPLVDPSQIPASKRVPPPVLVDQMSTADFFGLFAQLLAANPVRKDDAPLVAKLAKLGIVAGQTFPAVQLSADERQAINDGAQAAAKALSAFDPGKLPVGKSGWTLPGHSGRFGTNYMLRAQTARYFLGILPAEDAIYLTCVRDSAGQPLDGGRSYTLHFSKAALPPVKAFWSVTLYDDQGYFTANSLRRFAIGDRDALKFNADGSLDLYVQRESPGADKEGNWLPAPGGRFNLAFRLYWPAAAAISGGWTPPPVVAAGSSSGR